MAGFVDKLRTQRKHEKLAREMTHAKSYDNASARRKAWGEVKAAPGQYAQGMFTDFVGAPVDIANMALTPFGLGSEKPVMGSRHLAGLIGADETALPYQAAQYIPLDAGDIAMSAKLWGPALVAALGSTAIASKASKGAKLSDLAQVIPKQRGIFAGVGAKTANHANLDLAKKLQAQGVPDPDIWKQTGWALDPPDKIPRFEIPDDAATAKFTHLQERGADRIADRAIEHPALFSAYDDTRNISQLGLRENSTRGSMDSAGGYLVAKAPDTESLKSVGIHELQHAIQQREGFARGGSPEALGIEEAKASIPSLRQSFREAKVAYDDAVDMGYPQEQISQRLNALKQIENDLTENLALAELGDPYKAYQRLAGEAEARLTQARMNMTPEQRLAQYPYEPEYFQKATGVPLSDLIVRKEGGTAMSLPEGQFTRIVDAFGNGNDVKMYDDASGKYLHKVKMNGNEKWQIGDMGMVDGKHVDYLDQPIGKAGDWLGGKQSFATAEDALASLRGAKISESAIARNAKYSAIPSTWSGDARKIGKKLIDEYGDVRFGSSTQSKSKYVTLPTGEKIRMSDHSLPGSYDSADFDYRYGGDIDQFLQSIINRPVQ